MSHSDNMARHWCTDVIFITVLLCLSEIHLQVEAMDNLALGQPTWQSSTRKNNTRDRGPNNAVDGSNDGIYENNHCMHTGKFDTQPWWAVDLGDTYAIGTVKIWNRVHENTNHRHTGLTVVVSDVSPDDATISYNMLADFQVCAVLEGEPQREMTLHCAEGTVGRYVYMYLPTPHIDTILQFCEVEIYVADDPEPDFCREFATHFYELNCYKFVLDKKNFFDAEKACADMGGYLAPILDNAESEAIKGFVDEQSTYRMHYWFGGFVTDDLSHIEWDNPAADSTYLDWAAGYPRTTYGRRGGRELFSCLAFQNRNMRWKNRRCLFERAFVCHAYYEK